MTNTMLDLLVYINNEDLKTLETVNKNIYMQMTILFMNLLQSQFKWKGIPDEIPEWVIEKILTLYGQGVLFKIEDTNKYAFCMCSYASKLTLYGEPISVIPLGLNGRSFDVVHVKEDVDEQGNIIRQNAVLFKNNTNCISSYFMLKPFIERLCFIWESLGINEGLSRIKSIIYSNKDVAPYIKSQISKILGSPSLIPVISEKSNILKEIEKLDLDVAYEPSLYWEDFDNTFQFILQMCGINCNLATNKKERLIVPEVNANNEFITLAEDTRLDYRRYACNDTKRIFNIDINVENRVIDIKYDKNGEASDSNKYPPVLSKN